MAFTVNHIEIDGSINIDGSIFQWNQPFVGGGGGGGTGDVAWGSGNVGSDNQIITALGDGSIVAETGLTFDGSIFAVKGDASISGALYLNNKFTLKDASDRPGLLEISNTGSWAGIQIKAADNLLSLMTNGYFSALYDDSNNQYIFSYTPLGGMTLYNNGSEKFEVTNSGVRVNGDVSTNGSMIVDSSSQYYYLGNPGQNGSWRWYIEVTTGDLIFEKRVSGTWTYKSKIS
jgi:hypothetical protein